MRYLGEGHRAKLILATLATYGYKWTTLQGYLAHRKTSFPWDPIIGLCLGPCGDPKGVSIAYERGTPVSGRIVLKDISGWF